MQRFDITALGECLIDFTPVKSGPGDIRLFAQNPGGAPANMIAAASKLGAKTAFIGKVGQDQFGHFLENTLIANGICTDGMIFSDKYRTTLAFVTLDESGQREFVFYRDPGADQMLENGEADYSLIDDSKCLHISSLAYDDVPTAKTADAVAEYAKKKGKLITYDANWRPLLWKDASKGKRFLKCGLKYADIVKASEEELVILSDEQDEMRGVRKLLDSGIKMVVVTKGENGSTVYFGNNAVSVPSFKVDTVDTTGAGDAFFGTFVYQIAEHGGISALKEDDIRAYAVKSSAFAALSTTKLGGIPSLPEKAELEGFLKERG